MTSNNLKQGYPVKQFQQPTKRYCQQLDLVDDAALIAQYKHWHHPANNWPEIAAGIRSVGILEMEIYLYKNHVYLFVIIGIPERSSGCSLLCSGQLEYLSS